MANRLGKRTLRLSIIAIPWILAALFVLLIGWLRNINLLMLLGYLLAAIPVLNLLAATRALRGLSVRRRIAQPVYAGLPFAVSVHIAPTKGVRLGLRVEDGGPGSKLSWFIGRLEREGRSFRGQAVLPKRGRYRWGPLLASSAYPFGIVYRCKELTATEEIIVLPQLGRLHRGAFRRLLWSAASDRDRRLRAPRRHAAAQEQVHGLRPYRAGDNPRAVHWRTSARRGEWMVREFEDVPGENLLLIFDPTAEAVVDQGAFEAAVCLAATIAAEWRGDRGGRLIAVVAGESPIVLDALSGAVHVRRILEQLAVVRPSLSDAVSPVLLERLTAAPSAAIVVVAAKRGGFAENLRQTLRRPFTCLNAADLGALDFYEPPTGLEARSCPD